ncbi:diguanylate cyclase/phosphodiesterase (GGDEF & EAL domains) with PAS/PAC sensor(s) [hydrothermal vent metagenome]|uniref:histidine kinase n=1 Tax=hydrothermal vent metagenome TaxID=652676 RepID=A0A3B0XQJ7_9ZZZZ
MQKATSPLTADKTSKNKSSIARRFILYIVLFSSFITLITTSIQLYREYNSDIDLIRDELQQIESVHLESLSAALWTSNQKLLQTSINGILKIRDMQYAEIRDPIKVWASAGKIQFKNNIQRSYPIEYKHRNKNIHIGTLTVNVNLDGVYQRLLDTAWIILISNAFKTSLVAFFIYFLFHQLVARHLSAISDFSEKHDPLSNNSPLALNRNNRTHDEFDAVVKSINDMHERLHEQISEISNQKQYLDQTFNGIGDAVITTDNRGRVTRLNPVAERLTGWTNSDALQLPLKTIFPIVDASTRELIANPVDKVLSTGKTIYLSNHTTLIAKDGKEYHIADSAAPIRNGDTILGMVLVFNDVTEQYKMRAALQENEKKLRLFYSQVPGILYQFEIDTHGNKRMPYVSPAIESYLGISAETVMHDAERWFDLIHPDDVPSLEKSVTDSLKSLNNWEWEGRFIRPDGELIWLHGTSIPERTENGSTIWHGLFIDITDRVHAEEAIHRSQKMDALGKLTGGIAHDYNNMLGVVLGYSELLMDKLNEQPNLLNYAGQINHAGERGAKLTKKLLAFSKNKSSNAEKLNINTLLNDERHMLEKTLTARIKLEYRLAHDLWPAFLDESDLEDAILNMSINAMHAIKRNGQLTIKTYNEPISVATGEESGIPPGDYVVLSIRDTGCGMDQTTREKIFDPFYSTKGEKGTGLGLSQVYGFINRCNGAIRVDSMVHQGTTFTLYFPRFKGKKHSKNQTSSNAKTNLEGKESILVVDDEPALLDLTCEILSQQNYRIFKAERAKQALDILKTEHIDILLTDVIMPDMDGYALAAIVRENHPAIKIQLASGYSSEQQVNQIDEELSKNLLHKPYDSQTLLKTIRNLLR